jgi:predicted metal-binding membrane protein
MTSQQSSPAFFGTSALLFVASAALTIVWCGSMSSMPSMPMPGGWGMSMTWMRMPGQTWFSAAASFLGMWLVMMMAMMLPSLVPMLRRYRQAVVSANRTRLGWLTVIAGAGYFLVWTLLGMAIFPLGLAAASAEMHSPALARAVPGAAAAVVLIAGAFQFTRWKAHHLACCREAPGLSRSLQPSTGTALRQGMRFGLHCALSSANLTAILLAIGIMDLRAMAAVTLAITAERLAPSGHTVARAVGAIACAAALLLIARAAGLA